MKYILKTFVAALSVGILFSACNKAESLASYADGVKSVLASSATTVAPTAADSLKTAITFSWTNPTYANDSSTTKYVIEIDSTGRNFSKSIIAKTVSGSLSYAFTAKELNTVLLSLGFQFNVAYDIDVRLTSSYANNNQRLVSNTVKVRATPYKIPPKIALPTSLKLYLVGDASQGGWNNPVPVPTQEFARLDETTWVGVFNLNGGKQYLVLPVNGDWSNKYSVANNTLGGLSAGGDFGYNLSDNFPGPSAGGMYKITMDFQQGKFTCVPYTGPNLPTNLFIVGDATPGGWNNPVPVPSQQFTRSNSVQFTLSLNNVVGGKQYLFLPVNGDWSNKYAVANNSLAGLSAGGTFGYNLSDNFPGPSVTGNYKFDVNFATAQFVVTKLP